jgi:RimJ/RimL family protein N-acetyltransferase
MDDKFRVYLRAFELDDYKISSKWRNDNEIWNRLVGPKYFVSPAYEKRWVEDAIFNSSDKILLAICLKENNDYIGNAYLTDIDWINRTAISGSLIGEKKYWSKGLGTEARLLLNKFAFYERGINRIWAKVLEDNIASQKMLEKCGYKKEGLMRQAVYKNGTFKNLVIMSVLREDFDKVIKNYI